MLYLFILIQSFTINTNPTTWQTNFEDAKQIAAKENKNILMVFSGSDWCAPCIKFKKNILVTEEFEAFEKDNLVVLYLDFPKKKKNRLSKELTAQNDALAEKYNRSGFFPNILLLDQGGTIIKNLSYEEQSSNDFIKEVEAGL